MEGLPHIEPFEKRYHDLDSQMAASDFYSDQRHAAAVSREHQKLHDLLDEYKNLQKILKNIDESKELLEDDSADESLKELAREDIANGEEQVSTIKHKILVAMLPPEESDSRNTVIEIRAGTGGDEASLFAGDLFRMYTRYAEIKGWKVEIMSSSESEAGGYKEIICLISGNEVYKNLKFESGVHRVQRIPVTESNGRIHTSAATVAVLPEAEEVDIQIAPEDLEISICRASGPGGQGVNTTDSAVKLLHKPTGMQVYCADERSQIKNKAKAMKVLRSRLLQKKEEEERSKYAEFRKNQIGSGDRSERIRTYNFPQSRITDHRIGLTLHNLTQALEGEIDELIDALIQADYQNKIDNLLCAN